MNADRSRMELSTAFLSPIIAQPALSRLLLVAALLGSAPGPCDAQSLPDVLRATYARSSTITRERDRLPAARAQVTKAVAGTEPTVVLDGAATRGTNTVTGGSALENSLLRSSVPRSSYDIVVDQPVFRGGRTIAEVSESVAAVRAAAAKLASTEQDVFLQAARDYVEVLCDRVDAQEAQASADLAERILSGARDRVAKEDAGRLDVLTAQATLEESSADAQSAASKLADAEEQFRRDTGTAPGDLSKPIIPAALIAVPDGTDIDVDDNPDVQYARYVARSSRDAVRVARSAGLPSAELEAAARGREDAVFIGERETVRSISLKVHVPLFSGGVVRADVDAKRALAASDEDAITEARNDAMAKARSAVRQMALLGAARDRYSASVASKQAIVTGQGRLNDLGEASQLDILIARRSLTDARRAENRAVHDQIDAQLAFVRALGHMTLGYLGAGEADPDLTVSARKLIRDGISIPFVR